MAVRSYGLDTDFGFVCTVTLTLEMWPWFKVMTHPHGQQYAKSQLRIVCSGLHLVTYLDVGNFCDKSTETTLHETNVYKFFLHFPIPASQANSYR